MHTVLWETDRNSTARTGWTPFVSDAAEVSGKWVFFFLQRLARNRFPMSGCPSVRKTSKQCPGEWFLSDSYWMDIEIGVRPEASGCVPNQSAPGCNFGDSFGNGFSVITRPESVMGPWLCRWTNTDREGPGRVLGKRHS